MKSRCSDCSGVVKGEAVMFGDRLLHPNHFRCSVCQLTIKSFFFCDEGQKPTCHACWKQRNPKCKKCQRFVSETYISAMNHNWHLGCFLCTVCAKPFPGGRFVEYHGKPYDLDCYWGLQLRKFINL
ncbi:hypothetical protein QR680_005386 [Steinernema hermaphroditum]|uniref:LIM zinc-binding domain-containing protein n=1 Tax=Steinernema hermaphroditum TaxID=289476 RepID=A0AA39HU46_9BILA|nr:hypothetical protein QR680_005386 [Steinernema hermaphroditum]